MSKADFPWKKTLLQLTTQGRWNGAVALLRDVLARASDATAIDLAQLALAEILSGPLRNQEAAIREFRAISRRKGDCSSYALSSIAFCHLVLKNIPAAVDTYESLVVEHPGKLAAWLGLDDLLTLHSELGNHVAMHDAARRLELEIHRVDKSPAQAERLLKCRVEAQCLVGSGREQEAGALLESELDQCADTVATEACERLVWLVKRALKRIQARESLLGSASWFGSLGAS